MLETLWYTLLLGLQIIQTMPQVDPAKLDIEVYFMSAPVYRLAVEGVYTQGRLIDTSDKKGFGEFEATRRTPQTFVIFPLRNLPEAMASGPDSGPSQGAPAGASPKPTSPSQEAAAGDRPAAFVLDFTESLRQLRSFSGQPRQKIEVRGLPEKVSGDKNPGAGALASPRPQVRPATPKAAVNQADAAGASAEQGGSEAPYLDISYRPGSLLVAAPYAQVLVIINLR